MKLFYSPGASSLAAHIALREADRQFELERVDLRAHRTASGADFHMINPNGYVPALELDPSIPVLTEVAVILQYIADLTPGGHLAPPSGTFGRYRLQALLNFISSEIHKQLSWLFMPDTPALTAERVRSKIDERFRYLNDELATRRYLASESFSVADCYLFAMLRWCERFGLDLTQWPNLDDYFNRIALRPAVQAALDAEGLLERKRARRSA